MRFNLSAGTIAVAAAIAAGTLVSRTNLADEPTPPVEVRVARLVKQLGSESYQERHSASRELADLGAVGRRELEAAAASDDPEVRLRAGELLEKIKLADLWLPGIVSCQCRGELASHVAAAIAGQTGNHILLGDPYGSFENRVLHFDHEAVPYWQAIDELCRETGNRARQRFESREGGIVLVAGTSGKFPTAYAGPLRAQITGAQRSFTEKLDYSDVVVQQSHNFELELNVLWEDRFCLVAYRPQPELLQAITDTGAVLTSARPGVMGWTVSTQGTHQLSAKLSLTPPPVAAKTLDRLVLRWGLMAVGDLVELAVDDVNDSAPHRRDDVELTVEKIEPRDGNRFDLTLVVSRELTQPDPQDALFQEFRTELFDTAGKGLRLQTQSNELTSRGAKMRLTFVGDSETTLPKSLRFTYPRIRSQRDVEIAFRNVPLPTGRPN